MTPRIRCIIYLNYIASSLGRNWSHLCSVVPSLVMCVCTHRLLYFVHSDFTNIPNMLEKYKKPVKHLCDISIHRARKKTQCSKPKLISMTKPSSILCRTVLLNINNTEQCTASDKNYLTLQKETSQASALQWEVMVH